MTTESQSARLVALGDDVLGAFTTTAGGVSEGEFASLNMSYEFGDEPDRVSENRRRAAAVLGYDPDRLVVAQLVHGAHVAVIDETDAGRGAWNAESGITATDALVTNVPGIPVCVLVADCAPVLLFDPVRRAVGVSHAGWRGARDRVVSATVELMRARYGSDPADLRVAIGPCIATESFEMGPTEADECAQAFPGCEVVVHDVGPKPHVNLRAMVHAQLESSGVAVGNVQTLPHDTFTTPEFFSHRRSIKAAGITGGRLAGIVMLR